MAVNAAPRRRLFTRDEYHRMGEVGILTRGDRVELIKGEIVEMAPIGPRHSAFISNLVRLLITRLNERAVVVVQGPIVLADDTEPEPDIAVIRHRAVPYRERHPATEDALLLIEVAESSLDYGRTIKRRLYAEAGIPEYWVIDGVAETVDVHRAPRGTGYEDVTRIARGGTTSLQAFPDVALTPAEIFA